MTNLNKYNAYIGILPKCELQNIISTDISCPLGQLVIASYAKKRIKDFEAFVFFGEKDKDEEILLKIKKLKKKNNKILVGITLNSGNVNNAQILAKKIHNVGADIFFGGPETWMCWEWWNNLKIGKNIMDSFPYIQGLVLGAGERVVMEILKGKSLSEIPNIVYRDEKGVIRKPSIIKESWQELDFANIVIDYNLLSKLDKYKGVTYLWSSDCHQAKSKMERCYFCGRVNLGNKFRKANIVWQELDYLYKKGIKCFYNSVDTIVSHNQFKKFVEQKPKNLIDDRHKILINAHHINNNIVPYLKKLNATVSIGVESFGLFDKVGKYKTTLSDIYDALDILKKYETKAILSFVIGLPGENKKSLAENRLGIVRLIEKYGEIIEMLEVSPLTVTTGSRAFKNLMKIASLKYADKYWPFDVIEMMTDYFHYKCENIERRDILNFIRDAHTACKELNPKIKFDCKGITSEEKEYIQQN